VSAASPAEAGSLGRFVRPEQFAAGKRSGDRSVTIQTIALLDRGDHLKRKRMAVGSGQSHHQIILIHSRSQSYGFELQRQRCKTFTSQLIAGRVFRIKIIFR
jgi:hypothetical protein